MREFKFISDEENIRLDSFISGKFSDISRTKLQNLIKENKVFVNGKNEKAKFLLKSGDEIEIFLPDEKKIEIKPENIEIEIVYEDEYLLVVNKPVNMVVHPATSSENGTLVNALLNYTTELSTVNEERPGIVHRLDKDTTGLIIIAKDNETHLKLVDMFSNRSINKRYVAICNGVFKSSHGTINKPIGRHPVDRKKMAIVEKNSKEAITEYDVVFSNNNFSLLDIKLHTGRTHQIRVHLSGLNHPILGDKTYGVKNEKIKVDSQMLHAYNLDFIHPITNERIILYAKPPANFLEVLNKIGYDGGKLWEAGEYLNK